MDKLVFTVEAVVEHMKREILADVSGVAGEGIPCTVTSFEELHDYIDANCYGGFCDDDVADAFIAHFGGHDENGGYPDAYMALINDAQGKIDEWIKNGGLLSCNK